MNQINPYRFFSLGVKTVEFLKVSKISSKSLANRFPQKVAFPKQIDFSISRILAKLT